MVADFSSIRNKFTYPVYAALVFSVFSLIHAALEADRFDGTTRHVFFYSKIVFAILGFIAAYEFYRRPDRDWIVGGFYVLLVIYSVFFMWLAPLYEVSYLQCAVGAAFIRVRNRHLFAIIFGTGLMAIYATYFAQDRLNWKVAPANRLDWLFITIVFFILAWLIQNFAVRAFRREEDRLSRLGLVGSEAALLLSEVEARLQRPLDLSRTTRSGEAHEVMQTIRQELKVAQTTLRDFRAKTGLALHLSEVDLKSLWQDTLERLRTRLGNAEVHLPETSAPVNSDSEILRSVFFNLLLNSIESAELNGRTVRRIEIGWSRNTLTYEDGGTIDWSAPSRSDDKGLGLKLMQEDLKRLSVDFSTSQRDGRTVTALKFNRR